MDIKAGANAPSINSAQTDETAYEPFTPGTGYTVVGKPHFDAHKNEWSQDRTGFTVFNANERWGELDRINVMRTQTQTADELSNLQHGAIETGTVAEDGFNFDSTIVLDAHSHGIGILGGAYTVSRDWKGNLQTEYSANIGPFGIQISHGELSKEVTIGIGTNIGTTKNGVNGQFTGGVKFDFTNQRIGFGLDGTITDNLPLKSKAASGLGKKFSLSFLEENRYMNEKTFAGRLAATIKEKYGLTLDTETIIEQMQAGKFEFTVNLEDLPTIGKQPELQKLVAGIPADLLQGMEYAQELFEASPGIPFSEIGRPLSFSGKVWDSVSNLAKSAWSKVKSGWSVLQSWDLALEKKNPERLSVLGERDFEKFGLPGETRIEFKARMAGENTTISETAASAWNGIKDFGNTIKDVASDAWDGVKNFGNSVKDATSSAWGGIKDTAKNAWDGFKDAIGWGDDDEKETNARKDDREPRENNSAETNNSNRTSEPEGAGRNGPGGTSV